MSGKKLTQRAQREDAENAEKTQRNPEKTQRMAVFLCVPLRLLSVLSALTSSLF